MILPELVCRNSILPQILHDGFFSSLPTIATSFYNEPKIFSGRNLAFYLTTNATLLTDEIAKFFSDHNFHVTISIDGPRQAQDRNRVFVDGRGTYDIVINNISSAIQKYPDTFSTSLLSMVVDQKQDYQELVDFLNEPLFQSMTSNISPVLVEADAIPYSDEFIEEERYRMFLGLTCLLRGNSETKNIVYQGDKVIEKELIGFQMDLSKLTSRPFSAVSAPSGPCIPGKLRLFVDCNGVFYPCEKVDENPSMQIGSLDTGFNYENISKLLNIGKMEPLECQNCWAFNLCSICARLASEDNHLSVKRRKISCVRAKNHAYQQILNRILVYENNEHEKAVKRGEH